MRVSQSLILAIPFAVWSCGSSTEPPTPTPTTITLNSTAVTLDAVGATQQLSATVKDQTGAAMTGQTLTWSSDNTAAAQVDQSGLVTAVANGTAQISAAVGSVKGTATATVHQAAATVVKISGDAQTGVAHSALANPIVAQVNDRLSHPVTGAVVTFTPSTGAGTAAASADTTDAAGQVSTTWTLGGTSGAVHMVAAVTVGSANVTFDATATPAPADSIAIDAGDGQTAGANGPEPDSIVVLVMDAYGSPVGGSKVAFEVTGGGGSVSPDTVVADVNGKAAALWTMGPVGAQTLSASVAGLHGSPLAFSATATNVTATSVLPDTMVEGASATITGTGFDANTANDAVTVDGMVATITAATTTSITFTVPTADCKPARGVTVQVTANAVNANALTHPVQPVYLNMNVGQQTILETPSGFCLQLAPSAAGGDGYLIGMGAAAEGTALNPYVMTAVAGSGGSTNKVAASPVKASGSASFAMTPLQREVAASWDRQRLAEQTVRNFESRYLSTVRPDLPPARQVGIGAPSALTVPAAGDTVSLNIPTGPTNFCTQYSPIKAVVKAVGTHGIWVTDLGNPVTADSLTDAEIQAYSDTLDTQIYATDVDWFGAPSDIDQNGHIYIVLSHVVDTLLNGGMAGFVFSGDLYAPGVCPQSNQGELFYGNVPNPSDANVNYRRTKAGVEFQLPSLIAHEFTHNIQNSRRLIVSPTAASNVTMNSWEAEGQAMFAQNAVGDDVLGNSPGNNYGWSVAHQGQGARWYGQAFDFLAAYYGFDYDGSNGGPYSDLPEHCTLYGTGLGSASQCYSGAFYGPSYAFQKYISDRFGPSYPGGQKQLERDVIYKNPGLAGRPNWEALLGLSHAGYDSLFAQWGAMLWVDDSVPGIGPELQMTSWNLASIFGPTGYQNTTCGMACVLKPTAQAWGAFTQSRSVSDGSNAYTLLTSTGAHAALSIKVRDGSNNPLSTAMRPALWIVRVK